MDLDDLPETETALPPRRFSRERLSRGLFVLPTLFTVGNLFCGYLSIWRSIQGAFEAAAVYIIVAAVLDALDGRVARWTRSTSRFGEEYDSLADLVSFGVAPAVLAYSWGLSDFQVGWMASFLFVVCGSMRLARFNIQTKVVDKRYFVGLPIPAAAGAIASLVLATPERLVDRFLMAGLLILTVLLSYLMISTIRYRSFKEHLDIRRPKPIWILPLIALAFALIRLQPALVLLVLALAFALSGPAAKLWSLLRRRRAKA